jgi:multiple antibiotic resistance protein
MFHFDFKEIATITMVLFAVIDVIGSLPVILDLRRKHGHLESGKASIISLVIMVVFLFLGKQILNLIGIDVDSFAIAGSIVIFLLGIEMILGITIYNNEDAAQTASVVPLAFPLIAGTGTLTTLLTLRAQFYVENIIVAIVINAIIVYAVLKSSSWLARVFGNGGMGIIRKVFGIILMALAVKIFRTHVGV